MARKNFSSFGSSTRSSTSRASAGLPTGVAVIIMRRAVPFTWT
ncbi:hypothetical protein ACFQV2_32920 [Actinokineospora soli]|uniref:Uncharacterized protein n=1 Tax=Actinokineospora soli TaxID=1048753 RepID=A0ABW2TW97_9PSEU